MISYAFIRFDTTDYTFIKAVSFKEMQKEMQDALALKNLLKLFITDICNERRPLTLGEISYMKKLANSMKRLFCVCGPLIHKHSF